MGIQPLPYRGPTTSIAVFTRCLPARPVPVTVNYARKLTWFYTVESFSIKRRGIVSGIWPE